MGHRLSKIVTRTGDAGTTGLGNGARVAKDADRIDAIGAVDELNSSIGVEVPPGSQLDLSGPRWGLLMRLHLEEARGNCDGITPTALSRVQSVSKNTISALLRGLEDQGLIQRALDPQDRRLFRIQLTPHGREVVRQEAPARVQHLNRLAQSLTDSERQELADLLWKLFSSIYKNCPQFLASRAAYLHEEQTVPQPPAPLP